MGVDTAPAIAAALMDHGRPPATAVAVVADGSMPTQRTVRTTLAGLAQTMSDEGIRPPAVWVVGEVVGLSARG
jgi:uroporphyrin-III C-methyltransferase/precorrin-2 dehydrogenase/sirohydrochlorin ferrochelatase